MKKQKERIHWIDMLKGMCMIAILLFHTEVYYNGGTEVINYNLYVCNALVIFFFLSGYHFYKPEISACMKAVEFCVFLSIITS